MWKKAEVRIPKKLRRDGGVWLPQTIKEMELVGQMAIDMIRNRILKTQTDGTGRKLPKLKTNTGMFFTAINDNRFDAYDMKRITYPEAYGREEKGSAHALAYLDGYAALKKKVTGKRTPRKDGFLTGDMWKGFSQLLKKVKGGWAIQLMFVGGTKVGKKAGWGNKTVKRINRETNKVEKVQIKVPKMKTVTLRNRDKARGIQLRGDTPVVSLLSLTSEEKRQLMEKFASLIKPFGDKAKGQSFDVSTKLFRKT